MRSLKALWVVIGLLLTATGIAREADSPTDLPVDPSAGEQLVRATGADAAGEADRKSAAVATQVANPIAYPIAKPGVVLSFPHDHGAHPEFRTEWWYVTGWLTVAEGPKAGEKLGFQVTFFRTRPGVDEANPSRFTPSQVLFAHAALSDPSIGHLLHGERSAREGFGIAEAATHDADVTLRDWHFRRRADGTFVTDVVTPEFGLSLAFDPTQAVFAQGEGGYSRKGPSPEDASVYYSLPYLAVSGTLARNGTTMNVTGEAWLDREWASSYLAPNAVGWDWTGLNLDDGSALMAFRIRGTPDGMDKKTSTSLDGTAIDGTEAKTTEAADGEGAGRAGGVKDSGPKHKADDDTVWAGGSYRRPNGTIVRFQPGDVCFETTRTWRSPRTGAVYPVEQLLTVKLPEGERRYPLTPLFPDQELNGRTGGLPVYWEGAVTTKDGHGYLELTGYASRLRM